MTILQYITVDCLNSGILFGSSWNQYQWDSAHVFLWNDHLLIHCHRPFKLGHLFPCIYNAGSGAGHSVGPPHPPPPPQGGLQSLVSAAHYICVHQLARDIFQTKQHSLYMHAGRTWVCPLSLAVHYLWKSKRERPQSLAPKSIYQSLWICM